MPGRNDDISDQKTKIPAQKPETRIQREKREAILKGALDVFSQDGFRGTTLDQIAAASGISKPNLLYYFPSKEDIHRTLLTSLLETWLAPLDALDPDGEPIDEILAYLSRKLEMARDYPRESRLFANEILRGAPELRDHLSGPLKALVDRQTQVLERWMEEGRLARVDPHHLIFSIWSTTQHYADFDSQISCIVGSCGPDRFAAAETYLTRLFRHGLTP